MRAEDHTAEHSLDELARGLASGSVSRRKALRLMGAALVGGALASIPGVAQAAPQPCPELTTPCGKGGRRLCCPAGFTCCGSQHNPTCCEPPFTVCCRVNPPGGGRPSFGCTTSAALCESSGGDVIVR